MNQWLYLIGGGIAGTVARFALAGFISQKTAASFPYGTLTVNLIGCFLVGFFDTFLEQKLNLGPELRLLLIAGFCGAFTTFSAFMLETSNLLKNGQAWTAFGYVAASLLVGFLLFRLGVWAGEMC